MRYTDKFGMWNVKEVSQSGDPSGNDGPIITSYAQKLFLPIDRPSLWVMSEKTKKYRGIPMERYPGKGEPPPSRDTILGLVYLGLLHPEDLIQNKWSFSPYPVPFFNPFKTIMALYRMKNKHRNELWDNGGESHLFRFAFSVPLHDRAFILRSARMKVTFIYKAIEWISKNLFLASGDSSKLIAWLKYDIDPGPETFKNYFGENHPIFITYLGQKT